MAYRGQIAEIKFGQAGWNANENQELLKLEELRTAKNIRFEGDMVTKTPGLASLNANSTYANAVCLAGLDFWPNKTTQHQITAWSDGNIAVETSSNIIANVTAFGSNTGASPVMFLKCGEEQVGNNAKVLAFQAGQQTKFLTGTGVTFANIVSPSLDWSSTNWPMAGIIHDNRVVAWGNDNAQHAIYFSTLEDHTDFATGTPPVYDIGPGIGQYITACTSMQTTRLFIFKYPVGIFMIDTGDLPSYYMPVTTIRDDIGVPGPHCVCKVGSLGTWFIASDGHIYNLESLANPDVDIQDACITHLLGFQRWMQDNLHLGIVAMKFARLIYDSSRKEVWAIYRKAASTSNDIALVFDVKNPQQVRVTLEERGTYINAVWKAYNTTSLKQELYCAGSTGHIYRMNQDTRSVVDSATTAYEGIVQTPDSDLGAPFQDKRFDWIEVYLKSVGNYDLNMTTYIDGEAYATYTFDQGTPGAVMRSDSEASNVVAEVLAPFSEANVLAFDSAPTEDFTLSAEGFIRHKVHIGGLGKRIALKFYNANAGENFSIAKATIYYKTLGTTGEE